MMKMKFKRCLSYVLVFSILTTTLLSGLTAQSFEPVITPEQLIEIEKYRNEIPTKEPEKLIEKRNVEGSIIFTIADENGENAEQRINQNIIEEKGSFSNLTKTQQDELCAFLGVEAQFMEDCESKEFTLEESIEIEKFIEENELSLNEIKRISDAYGSFTDAGINIAQYAYIKENRNYSESTMAEIDAKIQEGYDVDVICTANEVAEILGCSISEVLKPSDEINTEAPSISSSDAASEISDRYFVDKEAVESIAASKGISTTEILSELNSETTIGANATAALTNATGGLQPYLKSEYISAPFTNQGEVEEYVDPLTGALYYTSREIELPGKNGLDLVLDLQFCSGYKANFTPASGTLRSSGAYAGLGVGWRFVMPKITNGFGETLVTLEDGGTYAALNEATGSNLAKYYAGDLRFNRITMTDNGVTYAYSINYKDGRVQYFDSAGNLRKVQDRYNNTIVYDYYERLEYMRDAEGDIIGTTYAYDLKTITDSLGRVITFKYSKDGDLGDGMYGFVIEIPKDAPEDNPQDNKTTNAYYFEEVSFSSDVHVLSRKVTQTGTVQFEYAYESVGLSFTDKISIPFRTHCINLTKIIYDYGVTSEYTYQKHRRNIYVVGSEEYYRVIESKRKKNQYSVLEEDIFDVITYGGVTTFDYSGYPSETYDITNPPSNYYWYSSKTDAYETEVQTGFNSLLRVRDITTSGDGIYESQNFLYNENYLPRTKITCAGSMMQYEYYSYDSLGNVTSYTGVNDAATSYTYDPTYSQLIRKYYATGNYPGGAAHNVEETYTLSDDKKSIISKQVKENSTVKEKTDYLYDSYGNITEERRYKDGFTDYVSTYYDYTDNQNRAGFNGAYLTSTKVTGIKDVDGNLIPATATVAAGEIVERMTYDMRGNMIEQYDGNGNKTTFEYDNKRRITKAVLPNGATTTIVYDDSNNTATETLPNGRCTLYQYDLFGNLLTVTDIEGETSTVLASYTYDEIFRLVTEQNHQTNGYKTQYTYDGFDRILSKKTYDYTGTTLLAEETTSYEDGSVTITDEDGNTKIYDVITHTVVGDENSPSIITKSYINEKNELEKKGNVLSDREVYETYVYNNFGTLISKKSMLANDKNMIIDYTYKVDMDYAQRKVKEYDADGNYMSYTYNALGQLVSFKDREANAATTSYATTYTYDNLGRLLSETIPIEANYNQVKNYGYDRNSNLILEKTSNNGKNTDTTYSTVEYTYDNMNRLNTVRDGVGNYTQYYYDTMDNPLRVYTGLSIPLTITGLDEVTGATGYATSKYEYDKFNRLTKYTDPMGESELYTYDYNGNTLTKTDRNGGTSSYTYDGLSRIKSANIVGASDANTQSVTQSFDYALTGLRTSETTNGYTVNYKYDAQGNVIEETEPNIKKTYQYEANGLLYIYQVFVNDVRKVYTEYLYNADNSIRRVFDYNGSNGLLCFAATYEYDKNGAEIQNTLSNGTVETRTYNRAGYIDSVTIKSGDTVLSSYEYEYYRDGNRRSAMYSNGKEIIYVYDNAGRLTGEYRIGNDTADITYVYDRFNNRISSEFYSPVMISNMTEYTYDLNNRLLSQTEYNYYLGNPVQLKDNESLINYTYDKNGNMTSRTLAEWYSYTDDNGFIAWELRTVGTESYTYNAANQQVGYTDGTTTASYTYRPNGLRNTKTVGTNTERYIWVGDQVSLICDGNNLVKDKYAYGNSRISREVASAAGGTLGSRSNYMYNGHGDVMGLTDSTGEVTETYDYDAFGMESMTVSSSTNPFRYAGEMWDSTTNTYYLRARNYAPKIGRFTTEDPAQDGLNWYAYCNNNPIMFVDPSGMIMAGDNKLDESIQIILNGTQKDGSGGLSLAWSLAKSDAERKAIAEMANKIRGFNANNIDRHVILVNSGAAGGAGHTATLLLNGNDQGLLFSYYAENGEMFDDGQMRIAFLSKTDWGNLLYYNKNSELVASNGTIQSESYTGNLCITVSSADGKRGLSEIAGLYSNPGAYNLAFHNCDHMTSSVAAAAGVFYDKKLLPNDSFAYTKMFYTNYWLWALNSIFQN